MYKLNLVKPPRQRKSLTIRRYKEINIDNFQTDINSSCLLHEQNASLDCEVDKYDSVLRNIIDKHAPVQTKLVILRPNTEWYSDELRASKIERRRAERKMRKSKLQVDKQIYRECCITTNRLLEKCKTEYYSRQNF